MGQRVKRSQTTTPANRGQGSKRKQVPVLQFRNFTADERDEIVRGLERAFRTTARGLLVLSLTFVRSAKAREILLKESSVVHGGE